MASIPSPTKWGIHADIIGRPVVWGTLVINSISDNRVTGAINFRGMPNAIHGSWNEGTKQIAFDSPYATYYGHLTIFDDTVIRIRHFVLNGRLVMKPPSLQAGQRGTWIAATDISLDEYPMAGTASPDTHIDQLPPVGTFFLTSNLLHQQNFRR